MSAPLQEREVQPGRQECLLEESGVQVNDNWALPLGFAEVFILKTIKVLCFDTLLEMFILKGVRGNIIGRPTRDRLRVDPVNRPGSGVSQLIPR